MSIEENIREDANSSSIEVKERAHEELTRSQKLDNDIKEQDKGERKLYAYRVFALISVWLACVIVIVALDGTGLIHYSDTVMVTLLTTTTANVIGLFAIVNGYLFGTKKPK